MTRRMYMFAFPALIALTCALALCLPSTALAGNLDNAAKEFGQSASSAIKATPNNIVDKLNAAKGKGTAAKPQLVYAQAGTYTVKRLVVPDNVVLVGDEKANFKNESGSKLDLILVYGSVYGGNYTQGTANNAISLRDRTYSGKNGIVRNLNVTGSKTGNAGISVHMCKNAIVKYCKVNSCMNGIRISEGAYAKEIYGNRINNIGAGAGGSGIDIIRSDVGVISKNYVQNCVGHGISTATNAKGGNHNYNKIAQIYGNVIEGNKHQGIYVEGGTKVEELSGNKIDNNVMCGLAVRSNVHETSGYSTNHFATYVKKVKNNKIFSNKQSNISVVGKKAQVSMLSNNEVTKSTAQCGMALSESAKVEILGAGNKFNANYSSGVIVQSGAVFTLKGNRNQFMSNKRAGISADKSKIVVSGSSNGFSKNGAFGFSLTTGGTANITGTANAIAYNNYGVNATGVGAAFVSTGTGVKIFSNKTNGLSLNKKAKATLRNTQFVSNKKWDISVNTGCSCARTNVKASKVYDANAKAKKA